MKFPDTESLKMRFEKYSDDEIIEILKKKKLYQENAIHAAVQIALERGLINEEDDIYTEEFSHDSDMPFRIFPILNSEIQIKKVLTSLSRILYLTTIIPLIYCCLSYTDGETMKTLIFAAISIIWVSLVFGMERKHVTFLGYFMIVFLIFVISYTIILTLQSSGFKIIDWVILILSLSLSIYVILYMKFLIQHLKQ